MLTAKQAAIAAAVIAIWSAAPVFAQTAMGGGMSGSPTADASPRDRPGERASAVIRAIENEDAPVRSAAAVDVTDLARARAAGELQTTERGAPIQVERLQFDEPVRSNARAGAQATTRNASGGRAAAASGDRPQIVRADRESTDRTKASSVARLDDAQRYREQARYDSAKKRNATATAAASEHAAPATRGTQSKAEIAWSAPERQDYRTVREGNEPTLY